MIQKNWPFLNLWIQGGPRARLFFADQPKRAPAMNKIPLVKWDASYAYVSSTHMLLPRGLNLAYEASGGEKASGCLLHAKFLDTFALKAAESITPPAKPSSVSSARRLAWRVPNTVAAPSAVTAQVKQVARRACTTGWSAANAAVIPSPSHAPVLRRVSRLHAHQRFPAPAPPRYPRATSRSIIAAKPIMPPKVARSVLPPRCDSGITSSMTTNIIAPAAKLNAYGSIGRATTTSAAPSTAAIGSTTADS